MTAHYPEDVPLCADRIQVRGRLVSRKKNGDYGYWRCLIVADAGWQVWGTCPRDLIDTEIGSLVEFTATVRAKAGDPKFGFYRRPAAVRVIDGPLAHRSTIEFDLNDRRYRVYWVRRPDGKLVPVASVQVALGKYSNSGSHLTAWRTLSGHGRANRWRDRAEVIAHAEHLARQQEALTET